MSDSIGYYQPVLALLCNINNNCYCFKREPDNVVPEFDVTLKKKKQNGMCPNIDVVLHCNRK